ncbi:4-hydroxy-tetrahydrodipicolinate reductase [Anaerovorax odorimutans]|uniref:4-hydroxy-tetrahydrodipicolinate reductase n=1 Tax=Anaerovorax odorimutans TaxID=109327 RepID=UPI0004105805|nr:4-hydroxy-tetrahydrodipicolinate reductase [Anaerovorax odorimutans]
MKVIITAPKGKMDRLIVKVAAESDDIEIIATLGTKGRDYIGKDTGQVAGLGYDIKAPVIDSLETKIEGKPAIEQCDIIIDFSTVELSMEVLSLAEKYKKAYVCGTTGFSEEQIKIIHNTSKEIPVLFSANTSFVVNLMSKLLEISSSALGSKADIEIIDMHDKNKKDAPSGTAKEMGQAIKEASGIELKENAYHSVRSGDIPSSHTVIFGCMGERLEITHHAYNWECYARGACIAARFLYDKTPGLYNMKDVLGI